jgi:3-hydroxyacyl-[acyl-carrier-protein] dehydratase
MSAFKIDEIMRALPHRYPMLLVDRILEMEEGVRCVGLKNVTVNEPFFQGGNCASRSRHPVER